jgi:alpha,alpha-trehalase
MKNTCCLLILFIALHTYAQYPSPRKLYPGLFEQVQLSNIFSDSKTFTDVVPKQDPKFIIVAYNQHKTDKDFDLKKFVDEHFILHAHYVRPFKSDVSVGVKKHIDALWTILKHNNPHVSAPSSLIPLPHPYVIPGGRFREVYYWDSYFTMLGLQQDHQTQLMRDIINNFSYLIKTFGFIPNANRTYYLTRSQPPFFSMMVGLLAQDDGQQTWVKYLPEMLAEYNFWMKGSAQLKSGETANHAVKLPDGTLLNRYWDSSDQPREESYAEDVLSGKNTTQNIGDYYRNVRAAAESGWDFSSRWFADGRTLASIQTTDLVPVDLNCLLYQMELNIAHAYRIKNDKTLMDEFVNKAKTRKQGIQKYCWNTDEHWFTDYNLKTNKSMQAITLAGTAPLFFNVASPQQVTPIAATIQAKFLKAGGLVTTLVHSGQQWDAPNAWAPLQYMAIEGLKRHGQTKLAATIAKRWIDINTSVFKNTGKLMEKYNVTDTRLKAGGGEYPLQDGFGWTNGVLLKLMNEYKQ